MEGEKALIKSIDEQLVKLDCVQKGLESVYWQAVLEVLDSEMDAAINSLSNGKKAEFNAGCVYILRRMQFLWKYIGNQIMVSKIEKGRASKSIGESQ